MLSSLSIWVCGKLISHMCCSPHNGTCSISCKSCLQLRFKEELLKCNAYSHRNLTNLGIQLMKLVHLLIWKYLPSQSLVIFIKHRLHSIFGKHYLKTTLSPSSNTQKTSNFVETVACVCFGKHLLGFVTMIRDWRQCISIFGCVYDQGPPMKPSLYRSSIKYISSPLHRNIDSMTPYVYRASLVGACPSVMLKFTQHIWDDSSGYVYLGW